MNLCTACICIEYGIILSMHRIIITTLKQLERGENVKLEKGSLMLGHFAEVYFGRRPVGRHNTLLQRKWYSTKPRLFGHSGDLHLQLQQLLKAYALTFVRCVGGGLSVLE